MLLEDGDNLEEWIPGKNFFIFEKILAFLENLGLQIFLSKNTSWSQTASSDLKTPKIGFLRKFFCPPPRIQNGPPKIGRPPIIFCQVFDG